MIAAYPTARRARGNSLRLNQEISHTVKNVSGEQRE